MKTLSHDIHVVNRLDLNPPKSLLENNDKTTLIVDKTPFLSGIVKASPSKSYTQRAIMVGGINGNVTVINPLFAADTRSTINVWRELGATIKIESDRLRIDGFSGSPKPRGNTINVNESGTLLRFVLPILALAKGEFTVEGKGTLLERSNKTIVEALQSWGIEISGRGKEHKLPIRIKGQGEIRGGRTFVNGEEGSQVVSSLLIAAPFAKKNTTIVMSNKLVSRPYVDITIDVLRQAGIKIRKKGYEEFSIKCNQQLKMDENYAVHGDYSSAAFLIAAACLVPSDVTIEDLIDDEQGDKKIIAILRKMGAKIEQTGNTVKIKGPFELHGVNIDGSDIPDLVPILSTVACFAKGKTKISHISHLAHKESNRITAPAGELNKLGADIATTKDSLTITHSHLTSGQVSACNDHRLAMSFLVAGLRSGGIVINGVDCISKSYPLFLDHMKALGANFKFV